MAKRKKKRPSDTPSSASKKSLPPTKPFVLPDIITKHPNIWSAALILLLLLILFNQAMLGNKQFLGHDTLKATKCYSTFVDDALDRGIYPLWNPYIFSGMPSFASLSSAPRVNIVDTIINNTFNFLTGNEFTRILFNYLLFGWLMFFLLRKKKFSVEAALFAGVTIIFMPQFVAFGVHGHHSKLLTLALIPLIIFLVDRLLERRNLLYLSLTALVLGFQLLRAHVQVVYYTYMLIGLYFLFITIDDIIQNRKISNTLKSAGFLAAALVLAVALSSVLYISVYEYSHFSTRGGGAAGGGMPYKDATGWSFSPMEMMTFLVPGFVGFGGNTYWGQMGVTDYPLYMGILPLFLVGIAFILRRDKMTWFFGGIALFSLIVSFGRTLPVLYEPMYKFLPFFNKFRVPSMIHILLDIAVIIVAVVGLDAVSKLKEQAGRKGYDKKVNAVTIYSSIFGGIGFLIFLYLFFGQASYIKLPKQTNADMLAAYKIAFRDGLKMIILLALGGGAIIAFLKNKLPRLALIAILLSLTLGDLWMADFRIIADKYEKNEKDPTTQTPEEYFAETPVTKYLKAQKTYSQFRLLNTDTGNRNLYMYHLIENIGGYNAAKLQIYKEAIEPFIYANSLSKADQKLLTMLNTRYILKGESFKVTDQALMRLKTEQVPDDVLSGIARLRNYEFPGRNLFLSYVAKVIGNENTVKHYASILANTRIDSIPPYYNKMIEEFKDQPVRLFESSDALPRAFFVQRDTVFLAQKGLNKDKERYSRHRDNILNFMHSDKFAPKDIAILEEAPPFAIEPSEKNKVEITAYDIHEIELKADVDAAAHLVLSEIYYPAGWKAYVDGEETKIYKTNYVLRSIFLKPGKHTIKFIFDPASFTIGLWISLITFISLIAVVTIIVIRNKGQL